VRNLLGSGAEPAVITQNFLDFRPRYAKYHFYFGFCEFLNMCMVILSLFITDALLLNKFWGYGQDVLHYMWSVKHVGPEGQYLTHDPMCELFPTEVACYIRIGATTGAIDRTNYLCILSNNLFNQKYFLVLWLWWFALIGVSVLGLIYRFARIMIPDLSRSILMRKVRALIPDLSRSILMRKVRAWRLDNLELSGADCFVLDMLADNLPHTVMDQLLGEISKRISPKPDPDMIDNHNQSLLKSTTAL